MIFGKLLLAHILGDFFYNRPDGLKTRKRKNGNLLFYICMAWFILH
jgi:hypothetical protein